MSDCNRLCPICFSSEKDFLYQQKFNNQVISLMDNYDVVVCNQCGFIFADNIPSQEKFNEYYASMSKYEYNYQNGVVSEDHVEYFRKVVNFLLTHVKDKNASILDIGCSTGALLSIFKEQGYNRLLGLDPSDTCVKTVKSLYKIDAVQANIDSFSTDEKFDLIILSATLEHLVDFTSSMNKISSLLKENGLLFIEVPDIERFEQFIFSPFQQFSTEHINYFSKYSLKNLLQKYSFDVVEILENQNKLNLTIDPDIFVLSQKTSNKKERMIKDIVSLSKVKDYIQKSSEVDEEIKTFIKEALIDKDKIIVWGVGTHTLRLLGAGLDLSRILYFVDSNARYVGKQLNGIDIRKPEDIADNIPILISTHSYQDEIYDQIRNVLKLNNEIVRIYQ